MDKKRFIARLKQTDYKWSEAAKIKEEIKKLPLLEQIEIIGELRNEQQKSDNSDIIDVINNIIVDLKPKK